MPTLWRGEYCPVPNPRGSPAVVKTLSIPAAPAVASRVPLEGDGLALAPRRRERARSRRQRTPSRRELRPAAPGSGRSRELGRAEHRDRLQTARRRERGQTLVEYGLVFSLVTILAMMFFSGQGQTVLGNIGNAL
jgi:hypothetical protein